MKFLIAHRMTYQRGVFVSDNDRFIFILILLDHVLIFGRFRPFLGHTKRLKFVDRLGQHFDRVDHDDLVDQVYRP